MVAEGGPGHSLPEGGLKNVEDGGLIFFIGAGVVGVVAKQQPDIGVARAGVGVIRVAHLHRLPAHGGRTAVTHGPDACRLPGQRRGEEKIIGAAGQRVLAGANGVVIPGVGREVRQRDGVLGSPSGVAHFPVERVLRQAELHPALHLPGRAPADEDVGRRAALQIRSA